MEVLIVAYIVVGVTLGMKWALRFAFTLNDAVWCILISMIFWPLMIFINE